MATTAEHAPANDPIVRSNRIPAVAGLLYIVVTLVAVVFELNGPDVLDSPAEVSTNFVDRHDDVVAATTLFCVAQTFFLVFLLGLYAILHRLEASDRGSLRLGELVLIAGVCSVVVFLTYVMIYGALATSIVGDASPRTVLAIFRVGNSLDALSGFFSGVMVSAASLSLLRHRVLPRWISWLGLVAGACSIVPVVTFGTDGIWPALGAFALVGLLGQVIWPIAVNVAILVRLRRTAAGDATAAGAVATAS